MKKIVLVTGGFDPLHSGHIAYLKAAKQLGDILVVGVNSDAWLARKKGRAFMPLLERTAIIRELGFVDFVIDFDDADNTAKHAIWMVRQSYPQDAIIFANGGDRTDKNIPEMDVTDTNTTFAFGVGGTNKANSSSWILEEWKAPRTERPWGYYRVLHEVRGTKVKELTVSPGQQLSMQRHQDRAEHWHIAEGTATVYTINRKSDQELLGEFTQFQHIHIDRHEWHQLCNETDQPLRVVEIQYGPNCVEEDIERL
jgi:D-beta-D-heptose 7-phosphate kinase/D-beta-D-heptose 1-phosphate adenosyltransferase